MVRVMQSPMLSARILQEVAGVFITTSSCLLQPFALSCFLLFLGIFEFFWEPEAGALHLVLLINVPEVPIFFCRFSPCCTDSFLGCLGIAILIGVIVVTAHGFGLSLAMM